MNCLILPIRGLKWNLLLLHTVKEASNERNRCIIVRLASNQLPLIHIRPSVPLYDFVLRFGKDTPTVVPYSSSQKMNECFSSLSSTSSLTTDWQSKDNHSSHYIKMVSIDPESRKQRGGVTIPTKCFIPLAAFVVILAVLQVHSIWRKHFHAGGTRVSSTQSSYQESVPILRNPSHLKNQCKLYMAESIMAKNAGLGVFTGVGRHPGEDIGAHDMCIFISDAPKKWTHIRSHTFGFASFFGVRTCIARCHDPFFNILLYIVYRWTLLF